MSQSNADEGADARSVTLNLLKVEAVLARGQDLARRGLLEPAARELRHGLNVAPVHPALLDLLARVYAQAGDGATARKLWEKVVQIQPGHPGAEAGLRKLRELMTAEGTLPPPRNAVIMMRAAMVVFALAAITVITYAFMRPFSPRAATGESIPTVPTGAPPGAAAQNAPAPAPQVGNAPATGSGEIKAPVALSPSASSTSGSAVEASGNGTAPETAKLHSKPATAPPPADNSTNGQAAGATDGPPAKKEQVPKVEESKGKPDNVPPTPPGSGATPPPPGKSETVPTGGSPAPNPADLKVNPGAPSEKAGGNEVKPGATAPSEPTPSPGDAKRVQSQGGTPPGATPQSGGEKAPSPPASS